MLNEMRRLSMEDSVYALNVIIAAVSVALVHIQKDKAKADSAAAAAAASTASSATATAASASDASSSAASAYEERLEFLERLNRGIAVEFLEMSDMRRAYQAYKRSKGIYVKSL